MGVLKVIIADPDPQFAEEVNAELQAAKDVKITATTQKWTDLPALIQRTQPAVVIFGPGWGNERVVSVWQSLKKDYSLEAIYLTAQLNSALQEKASLFSGLLTIPVDAKELLKLIRLAGQEKRGVKKQAEVVDLQTAEGQAGKVVTIFSPKGGVGKTVLATNLAISLSDKAKKSVALIDVDLQFGDISVMLKLKPAYTLLDLANSPSLDEEKLSSVFTNYQNLVQVLAAPFQPEQADLISPELLAACLSLLKKRFSYIIVDTPPSLNDHVLSIIDQTDLLLLVATLDLPCLKNVRLCLKTLQLLEFPRERIKLVLNRVERGLGIDQLDVEKVFQEKVLAEIANDPAVTLAVNQGRPVVLEAPKTVASQQILGLSKKVISFSSQIQEVANVPA